MSQILINDYLKQLDVIKRASGSQRETIVREAFKDLLKAWGRQHELIFLAEYPLKTAIRTNIAVDGALLHELRLPLGYWEAKDAADDLDEEISKKFKKGYEAVAPFPLVRTDTPDEKARAAGQSPKAILRADPAAGCITLDSETTLRGVPPEAWTYKLGNRCALDWVLDQYKEKKPKDPTIREKFDTYRFADYKEKVINLLLRVTTVSVETVRIVAAMKAAGR
jgi:hypothetical protein